MALRSDGSTFPMELNIAPFRVGDEVKYVGIIRDISAKQAAEKNLIEAINTAEAANQSKSQFIANVSHEMRTPLNAVIGFSDMIASQAFGEVGHPKYLEYAKDIRNSGKHLMSVIGDVLDISAIEKGQLVLQPEKVALKVIVLECIKLLTRLTDEGGVKIEIVDTEFDDELYADPVRLLQVMINIIGNAVKFTQRGGHVQIVMSEIGTGNLQIAVTDNGPGIPNDKLDAVLRPFERMQSHIKSQVEGSGLGLPIAKYLIELHGGALTFNSEVGVGSVVTIILPRSQRSA